MKGRYCVSVLLAGAVALTAGACGVKKDTKKVSNEHTLEIEVVNLGYGIEWLEELAKDFMAENEGVDVNIYPTIDANAHEAHMLAGPKTNTADILMYQNAYFNNLVTKKLSDGSPVIEDLSDVYEAVADGETEKLKGRMDASIVDLYEYQGTGKYYAFPTTSDVLGLTYNAAMFEAKGWEVPLTTDQLVALCDTIKNANTTYGTGKVAIKPFAYPAGYWEYCQQGWWAQYEGLDKYFEFYNPDLENPVTPSLTDTKSGWSQQGRLEAVKVLEELVDPEKEYAVEGCLTNPFTETSAKYIRQNQAAMMPNGGWMINEQNDDTLANKFAFMKLPVVSALGEKLGITEQNLVDLIKWIDNGEPAASKPTFTSSNSTSEENVIKAVREARQMNSTSLAYTNNAFIPAYSDAIPLAKKFLVFMTTKKSMQTTFRLSAQLPLVTEAVNDAEYFDLDTMDRFNRSKIELQRDAKGMMVPMQIYTNPLMYKNGLRGFTQAEVIYPVNTLAAQNPADRLTPDEIIRKDVEFAATNWEHWVEVALDDGQ